VNPKELALAHFEKAILGICLAVMVWYLYSVLSIKPYSRKPEEFTDATTKAKTYVNDPKRTLPENEAKELTSINFVEQAAKLFKEYSLEDVKDYIHLQRWVRPFDYGINFRNEPKILAASKPIVQPNRGVMQTYLIDAAGNIKKQKIPKSAAKFTKGKGVGAGMGDQMAGMRRGRKRMGGSGAEGEGGSSGMSGMEGSTGGGDEDMMGSAMMGQGKGSAGRMGGAGIGEDLGGGGGEEGVLPPGGGQKFVRATDAPNKIIERMAKKEKKDEKKKDEEEIEEPIESREGYRFVEICATFPHNQQIVEYVKALRERARDVKLQYALVDVERQELTSNFTWTEFKAIPIKEQFDYVASAIGIEVEGSRALIPGLAMNVPLMDVRQREYLHQQPDKFPMYEKTEVAQYTMEEMDPVRAENERIRKEREERMRNPQYKRSEKKKDAESEKKFLATAKGNINLGFNDPNKQKETAGKGNNRWEVKTALIRYWDFTVEPGRKYRYRLRVKVFNPNYKRTDVADPELASRVLLTGPWSPVSDEVFVDFDNHWYVAEQKRSTLRSNEMTLEVHHWYRGMGQWLVTTFPQRIGQFVGLTDRAKPIKVAYWNDVVHEWEPRELKMENFDSGNLLVGLSSGNETYDVYGQERGIPVPREAVALNPFGDLVRHEEQSDKADDIRKSVNENYAEIAKALSEATGDEKKKDEADEKPAKGKGRGKMSGGKGGAM